MYTLKKNIQYIEAELGEHISHTAKRASTEGIDYFRHNGRIYKVRADFEEIHTLVDLFEKH